MVPIVVVAKAVIVARAIVIVIVVIAVIVVVVVKGAIHVAELAGNVVELQLNIVDFHGVGVRDGVSGDTSGD